MATSAERIVQSTAIRVPLSAVLSSDHASPATGKTIAVTISKNGAAFANPANGATNATEIGSGQYYVDLTVADTATVGPLIVLGTASATDNVVALYDVVTAASAAATVTSTVTAASDRQIGFRSAVDIANRALDHLGANVIDSTLGFTEVSRQAAVMGRIYDKLRQAELRRNVWRFAIRRTVLRALDSTFMLLAPSLWSATTTYFVGSLVIDQTGQAWQSQSPNNLNNEPQNTSAWEQYFGPMAVPPYSSSLSYYAGELVYTAAGDGTNRVYESLISANSDNPATATAWSSTTTYDKNDVITYLSVAYMSLIDLNLNNTPSASAANWASGTTYAINALVNGSDGVTYKSLSNGNVGHDPTLDGGAHWQNTGTLTAWTTVFVGGTGSVNWRQIGGAEFPSGVTLSTLAIVYPLGAGPSTNAASRNAFRLPAGYLREAPQDPKAGSISYLGAPTGMAYDDWDFEGNYIVSRQSDPIPFRFIKDVVDVIAMDPMFCEGLAARMALEACELITQSDEKVKTVASEYEKFMTEARMVNGIETGAVEPPEDDWITARR